MKLFARLTVGIAALVTLVANLPFKGHQLISQRAEIGSPDLRAHNCTESSPSRRA